MTMATAVFLVLLAFSFRALCHQSVQNYGLKRTLLPCQKQNVKALSNLVGNGKPILGNGKSIPDKLSLQFYCTSSMAQKRIVDSNNEVRYDFTKSCYVEGDLQLVVKVKINPDTAAPGSKECATLPEFQAAFLQQEPNKNTYMVLHPRRAHWFFTRSLGGCEMFVAKGFTRQDVLVIHSNLDK